MSQNEEEKEKENQEEIEKEDEKAKAKEEMRRKKIREIEEQEQKTYDNYKINYLSFETSKPITDLKTLCPICSNIPDISLSQNSEKGHYVKCKKCRYCYCCSHPRSKTLDDYISIMNKMHQSNAKCDIHKEKGVEEEAFFSCEICQKWMCEECINKHINEKEFEGHEYHLIRKVGKDLNYLTICQKHKLEYSYYLLMDFAFGQNICEKCNIPDDVSDLDVLNISKEKGECYFNQLKQIIIDGVEYLDVYCKKIYEYLIINIKNNPDLIKKAKEIYDKFLIRNRRALFYYQMLINTGTPSFMNYTLIENISSSLEVKFEKLEINYKEKLNEKDIDKILNFFYNNYFVGIEEHKLEDLKNLIDIKELYTFKKEKEKEKKLKIEEKGKKPDAEKKEKEKEEEEKEIKPDIESKEEEEKEDKKINYIDLLLLNENIVIGASDNGEIYIFEINNKALNGKYILSKKAHDQGIVSIDKIKNKKNKFVTCGGKEIKIWGLKTLNGNYIVECEINLSDYTDSNCIYLYVLNETNCISFINDDNRVIILNEIYKKFFNVIYKTQSLIALYQIASNDQNNDLFVIGGENNILLYKIKGKIEYKGNLSIDCFSGKSICYAGNDILLVGGKNKVYMVNIKNIKLEKIIKMGAAEVTCFLKFNDKILCCYGDTSRCHCWSRGIADSKETKFMLINKTKDKFENYFIEDEFYEYGITNGIWVDKDKFVCSFYRDDNLKIFQVK